MAAAGYSIVLSKDNASRFGPTTVLTKTFPADKPPAAALKEFLRLIAKKKIDVVLDMAIHIDDPASL
jgi:hypothetical protein